MTEKSNRWPVIAAFGLLSGTSQLLWLNFAGVTTVAAQHYGVSESAVGWFSQVFLLVYIVAAIPAGMILDRWFSGGLSAGAVLIGLGALVRLIGDGFGWVLLGQIIAALAQPLVLNAINGVATRYLAPAQRPTGIAIGTASVFTGMMVAFLLSAILPAGSQLRLLLEVSAAISVLASVAMLAGLRVRPTHASAPTSSGFSAVRVTISDPFVRWISAFAAVVFGTFVALSTFAQVLLEPTGLSADAASLLLIAYIFAGVIGCVVLPVWLTRRRAQVGGMVAMLVVTAAGCAVLAVAPGAVTGLVSITIIGFVLLPTLPVALELIGRRCGEAEGTASGLMWLVGNLGGLVVATVIGLVVYDSVVSFAVLAGVTLLGLPLVAALRPYIRTLDSVATQPDTADLADADTGARPA